jgi:hypothetical protein
MARGWEKEDVGEPEGLSDKQPVSAKDAARLDRDKKVRIQALAMQRERILSERTSSPHRRSALEAALLEIERELGELGWTIHI